jgi:hypothetical protein
MIALLRKDWRLNRGMVFGSIALFFGLQAMALLWLFGERWDQWTLAEVRDTFLGVGVWSLYFSPMLAACYGGIAFAAERQDHSADFLGILPVTRLRIVISKTIVGLACPVAFWLISVCLVWAIQILNPYMLFGIHVFVFAAFACLIMAFGLAWLLSAFLTSPAAAALISVCTTGALAFTVMERANRSYHLPEAEAQAMMSQTTLWVGIAAFIIGTFYYLRRVEP